LARFALFAQSRFDFERCFPAAFSPGPKTCTGNREADDTMTYLAKGQGLRHPSLEIGGVGQRSGTRVAFIVRSALDLARNDVLDNGAADANMA
jgi:hypothetical protein